MARIVWTRAALRDVERLHDFLVAKNPVAARQAVKSIRSSLELLKSHPQIGRAVEDLDAEFREWIVPFGGSGYVVLYRLDGKNLAILAVRHAREVGYGEPD